MLHPTIIGGAVIGVLSALTGVCITARARRLLEIKTQWIYRAEEKLGLVESRAYADGELADDTETGIIPRDDTKAEHLSWDGLLRSRRFSTSFLLTLLYLLLVITDLWVAFLFFRMS